MKKALLTIIFPLFFTWLGAQTLSITANNDTTICVGDTIALEAIITGGTAPHTIQWFPSDSLSCDTCATTLAYPSDSTTYMVVATDSNAEMDTAYVTVLLSIADTLSGSGIISVEVEAGINPDIASAVLFSVDSLFATDGYWTIETRGMSGHREFMEQGGSHFTYDNLWDNCTGVKNWDCTLEAKVCFQPAGMCTSYCFDTTVLIGNYSGSIGEKNLLEVNAYPNPTSDKLAISASVPGNVALEMYNTLGQQVLTQAYPLGLYKEEVSLFSLPVGTYFLYIRSANGQAVHRVVKE